MTRQSGTIVTAVGLVSAALAIYLLRLNNAAGLMVDDGWYILLAKSLAEGTGYRMISSPSPDVVPLYPPGFPALLSLVFEVQPHFPSNVWLLKTVSMAAMFGVGLLTYRYLRTRDVEADLAACAALATAITPAFVFLATSTLMSECAFTLFQLSAIVLIQRAADPIPASRARVWTVAAALAAAANVLIRSAGIGLALAIGLWLIKERLWKRAWLFGSVFVVCVLPWMVYSRVHAPTPEEQERHGGSIVYSYGEQIWMRWAGDPASGAATLDDIPVRIGANIVDVFARGMGGIFVPVVFRGPAESGEEMVALGGAAGLGRGSMGSAPATMAISLALTAVVLLGFVQTIRRELTPAELVVPIALAIIFVWPFWTFRFVVPLTPYLFLYLIRGIRTFAPVEVVRIALLCVIGLHASDHARYILEARSADRSTQVTWLAQQKETDEVLDWMIAHLGDGVIATTNPALVHLRTGHRTLSFDRPRESWDVWRARGVRYVVCLLAVELPSQARERTKLLYRTRGGFWVLEL